MEEQSTWKGHSFTLLVFTGIVVLASIFFVLGMLVGRAQGQKIATVAAAASSSEKGPAKADAKEEKPELTVYESSIGKEEPPALSRLDTRLVKPEPPAAPPPAPRVTPASTASINYQIGALRKSADAEKLLEAVRKRGFRAFILQPPAGDANPFYRVQVGPFGDPLEAEQAKKRLESAGYQPILKK